MSLTNIDKQLIREILLAVAGLYQKETNSQEVWQRFNDFVNRYVDKALCEDIKRVANKILDGQGFF